MNNFIMAEKINDVDICDELIEYFKKSDRKKPGVVYTQLQSQVNSDVKKSTDVSIGKYEIENHNIIQKYIKELLEITEKYIKKYKFVNDADPFGIIENFNIQHYAPNEGFLEWHFERASCDYPYAIRHLAFMTYLNDVSDGGETEWYYQQIKMKPQKGLTAIWPAEWTHTHRGITSASQHKYIVTGWFSFFKHDNANK